MDWLIVIVAGVLVSPIFVHGYLGRAKRETKRFHQECAVLLSEMLPKLMEAKKVYYELMQSGAEEQTLKEYACPLANLWVAYDQIKEYVGQKRWPQPWRFLAIFRKIQKRQKVFQVPFFSPTRMEVSQAWGFMDIGIADEELPTVPVTIDGLLQRLRDGKSTIPDLIEDMKKS